MLEIPRCGKQCFEKLLAVFYFKIYMKKPSSVAFNSVGIKKVGVYVNIPKFRGGRTINRLTKHSAINEFSFFLSFRNSKRFSSIIYLLSFFFFFFKENFHCIMAIINCRHAKCISSDPNKFWLLLSHGCNRFTILPCPLIKRNHTHLLWLLYTPQYAHYVQYDICSHIEVNNPLNIRKLWDHIHTREKK